MPRIDYAGLCLDAQRTASMSARPNCRAPCHNVALRFLATKLVRNSGQGSSRKLDI